MSKKAQTPIAITILVLATLVLCVTALFMFAFKTNDSEQKIGVSQINKVYNHAEVIDFYLDEVSSKIIKGSDPVLQFKQLISKYKNKDGFYLDSAFVQIETQLNDKTKSPVSIDKNNKLFVDFNIVLSEIIYSDSVSGQKDYDVKYEYKYHHERQIPLTTVAV